MFVLFVINVLKVESCSILLVCGNKEGCDGIGVVIIIDRKSNVLDVDLWYFFNYKNYCRKIVICVLEKKRLLVFVKDNSYIVIGCWKIVDCINRLGLLLIFYKFLGKCNVLME